MQVCIVRVLPALVPSRMRCYFLDYGFIGLCWGEAAMKRILTLASFMLAIFLFANVVGEVKAAVGLEGTINTGSAAGIWREVPLDDSNAGMVPTSLGGESAEESDQIFTIDTARKLFITKTSEGVFEWPITRINLCETDMSGDSRIFCLGDSVNMEGKPTIPEALIANRWFSDDWEYCDSSEKISFIYIPGDAYTKERPTRLTDSKLPRRWANNIDCTVSIGVLRPGYYNKNGDYSSGWDGRRYDNQSFYNADSIAAGILKFKQYYGLKKLVLNAKSGGANLSLQILNRYPGLVQGAYLYGSSCDYYTWKKDRDVTRNKTSPSPIEHLANIRQGTFVWFVDGDEDDVTGIKYSQNCVDKLVEEFGHSPELVKMIILPGETHGFRSSQSLPYVRKMVEGVREMPMPTTDGLQAAEQQ